MSSGKKRSRVDSDESADAKISRSDFAAAEIHTSDILSLDVFQTGDGQADMAFETREQAKPEISIPVDDGDGDASEEPTPDERNDPGDDLENHNLRKETDNYLNQRFSDERDVSEGRKDVSEGRKVPSEENEEHESSEAYDSDNSDNCPSSHPSNVDGYDDELRGEGCEESDQYEGSEDCHSNYSDSLTGSGTWPGFVWWPYKHPQVLEEGVEGDIDIKRTTAETLNPELCRFCRVFFDTWSSVSEFYSSEEHRRKMLASAHYDTMSEMKASASQGCRLCILFLRILRRQGNEISFIASEHPSYQLANHMWPSHLELSTNYRLHRPNTSTNGGAPRVEFWTIDLTFRGLTEHGIEKLVQANVVMIPNDCSETKGRQCQRYIDTRSPSHHSQNVWGELRLGCTENSTDLARKWLQECCESHSACRRHEKSSILPTRLIKIDCQAIRLCISANENCSRYATLSHCWGKSEVLRLQKNNLQAFLREIPYDGLCKTFRDAIDIARVLGFSWIWIDSLCIIQGDIDDWSKEASRMATVYGHSSLNIAATAAPDGTFGCLFERDREYMQIYQAEVEKNHQKQVYDLVDRDLYENISQAPLASRAWALQERILAPRTLHFTASQLFWECRAKQACETCPNKLPTAICYSHAYLPKQKLQSWSKIVSIYSACLLTDESDRLMAIAGIARRMQEQNGDMYFAGLWQARFKEQMCWCTLHSDEGLQDKKYYGLPSWSWTAVSCEVGIPEDTFVFQESYIDITSIDMTLEEEHDGLFGHVKGGILTIRSKYMIKTLIERAPLPHRHQISIGEINMDCSIQWDYKDNGLQSLDNSILILPIGSLDETGECMCILLQNTDKINGQYERVGALFPEPGYHRSSYYRFRDIMKLIEEEQFQELGISEESKTFPSEKDYLSIDVDEDGRKWYTITIV
ncbi:hypothetical protein NHQ30_007997 [Ciborinia camelliae]|nr:hypothetical protein NHQ30_007997 [Ciborinia camelliae]